MAITSKEIEELKDQSRRYFECGYLYTPIYDPNEILALIKRLESAEAALAFYSEKEFPYKEEHAREHFKKYPCENPPDSL